MSEFTTEYLEQNLNLRTLYILAWRDIKVAMRKNLGSDSIKEMKKIDRVPYIDHATEGDDDQYKGILNTIEYIRKVRNSITHVYFTEEEFQEMVSKQQYYDRDEEKIVQYGVEKHFYKKYGEPEDLTEPKRVEGLVIDICANLEKISWNKNLQEDS